MGRIRGDSRVMTSCIEEGSEHLQLADELSHHFVVVRLLIVVPDHGHGRGEDDDAREHRNGAHQLRVRVLGHQVAVAHRGHRHEHVPKGGGDRRELCPLHEAVVACNVRGGVVSATAVLNVVDGCGED